MVCSAFCICACSYLLYEFLILSMFFLNDASMLIYWALSSTCFCVFKILVQCWRQPFLDRVVCDIFFFLCPCHMVTTCDILATLQTIWKKCTSYFVTRPGLHTQVFMLDTEGNCQIGWNAIYYCVGSLGISKLLLNKRGWGYQRSKCSPKFPYN